MQARSSPAFMHSTAAWHSWSPPVFCSPRSSTGYCIASTLKSTKHQSMRPGDPPGAACPFSRSIRQKRGKPPRTDKRGTENKYENQRSAFRGRLPLHDRAELSARRTRRVCMRRPFRFWLGGVGVGLTLAGHGSAQDVQDVQPVIGRSRIGGSHSTRPCPPPFICEPPAVPSPAPKPKDPTQPGKEPAVPEPAPMPEAPAAA